MIAHPPCTYLTVSGNKWYYHPDDKDKPIEERRPHPSFPNRKQDREDGANFFMMLANADVSRIAVENPMGIMSTRWRKPDQSIQPYMFGDPYSKLTCLWLKNLRPLHPSKETDDKGERVFYESGKSIAKWYNDAFYGSKTTEDRQKARSKTFPGIARAIAEQWSIQILAEEGLLEDEERNIIGEDYLELLNRMFGDIRYKDSVIDPKVERKRYPKEFDKYLLNEIEQREQKLISYWKEKR